MACAVGISLPSGAVPRKSSREASASLASPGGTSRTAKTTAGPIAAEGDGAKGAICRQDSYMTEVKKRAEDMVKAMGYVPQVPSDNSRRSTRRGTASSAKTLKSAASPYSEAKNRGLRADGEVPDRQELVSPCSMPSDAMRPMPPHKEIEHKERHRRPLKQISFCRAVVCAKAMAVFVACAAMFVHFVVFTHRFQDTEVDFCDYRVQSRRQLVQELVYEDVTTQQFDSSLAELAANIEHWVLLPASRALNAVWGHMQTEHHTSDLNLWVGTSDSARLEVAYREWVELRRPMMATSKTRCKRSLECGQLLASVAVAFETGEMSGFSAACRLSPMCTTGLIWDSDGLGPDGAARLPDGAARLAVYEAQLVNGRRGEEQNATDGRPRTWIPKADPAIVVQRRLAASLGKNHLIQQAWTQAHPLAQASGYGLSRTIPIAYCGTYACMQGAVSAIINLGDVTYRCWESWADLKRKLQNLPTPFTLTTQNSAFFVVSQVSYANLSQQGVILASSEWDDAAKELGLAVASSSVVVSLASRALLARYETWDNKDLMSSVNSTAALYTSEGQEWMSLTPFNFSMRAALRSPPIYQQCENYQSDNFLDEDVDDHLDCYRVGAMSVKLDDLSRWLVVMVLPADAFGAHSSKNNEEVTQDFGAMKEDLESQVKEAVCTGIVVVIGAALVTIAVGSLLGRQVSRPLAKLAELLEALQSWNFTKVNDEVAQLQQSRRSRIRDVRELQDAFCKLSRGIEAFVCFVPETVVRKIIQNRRNNNRNLELELWRAQVTIMNSDIEGFTAISEKLPPNFLLLVLWRYLSVMTHIIKTCAGVVSEIQGDGLVVFWNTPDPVDYHASKACAAALAQQHAVGLLQNEFERGVEGWNQQVLNVRIGVHTGDVLSGHIGSNSNMKFGCLGQPLKKAADLQESCKSYGAKVLISGETHAELNESFGLLCRRLAGDPQDTNSCIYEVIGREHYDLDEPEEPFRPSTRLLVSGAFKSTSSLATSVAEKQAERISDEDLAKFQEKGDRRGEDNSRTHSSQTFASRSASDVPCKDSSAQTVWTSRSFRSRRGVDVVSEVEGRSGSQIIVNVDSATDLGDLGQGRIDQVTMEMKRSAHVMEKAVDAFNKGDLQKAQALAEDLVDDEAALALVVRIGSIEKQRSLVAKRGSSRSACILTQRTCSLPESLPTLL